MEEKSQAIALGFELYCEECGWMGDWFDVSYGRNCVHCWNDFVTVLADEGVDKLRIRDTIHP